MFKHVNAGERVVTYAAEHNAMLDAAVAHRAKMMSTSRHAVRPPVRSGIVWIENASETLVDRFGVLGVTGVAFEPATHEEAFQNNLMLTGDTPDIDAHAGRFVIALEPISPGEMGVAMISGVVQAKVNISNADHEYADIADAQTGYLKSVPYGAAQILYAPAGTGEKWCIVRIGPAPTGPEFCKLDAAYESGATAAAKLCNAAGTLLDPAVAITLQADWTLPEGAFVDTDQVIPVQRVDTEYYAIGHAKEPTIVEEDRIHLMDTSPPVEMRQIRQRADFGTFSSSWSDWEDDTILSHTLLGSQWHTDTAGGSAAQGSMIVGNSSNKWAAMAKGSSGAILASGTATVGWFAPGDEGSLLMSGGDPPLEWLSPGNGGALMAIGADGVPVWTGAPPSTAAVWIGDNTVKPGDWSKPPSATRHFFTIESGEDKWLQEGTTKSNITLMTDARINGLNFEKKTRTITIEKGLVTALSDESEWTAWHTGTDCEEEE